MFRCAEAGFLAKAHCLEYQIRTEDFNRQVSRGGIWVLTNHDKTEHVFENDYKSRQN